MWILEIGKAIWTEITLPYAIQPLGRSGHGMVSDGNNRLFIFGGRADDSITQELNDLWTFNIQTLAFIQILPN